MAHRQIWEIEVKHEGLNKYRHIRGTDKYVVEQKALAQQLVWNNMWQKKLEIDESIKSKRQAWRHKENSIEEAASKTADAQKYFQKLETILGHSLKVNDVIVWETLKETSPFNEDLPKKPSDVSISPQPNQLSSKYIPRLTFIDKIFPKLKAEKNRISQDLFVKDYEDWLEVKSQNEINEKHAEIKWMESVKNWKIEKEEFENKQKLNNEKIIERKNLYLASDVDAIVDYCDMVLTNSEYPECFSPDWSLTYQADSKILIADYSLPTLGSLPKTKSVKYVALRDEFVETLISASAINEQYDSVIYQISLKNYSRII